MCPIFEKHMVQGSQIWPSHYDDKDKDKDKDKVDKQKVDKDREEKLCILVVGHWSMLISSTKLHVSHSISIIPHNHYDRENASEGAPIPV